MKFMKTLLNKIVEVGQSMTTRAKSTLKTLTEDLNQLLDALLRNIFLLLLILGVHYFGNISQLAAYRNTINYVISIELLAIFLSNIALFFFTALNFTKMSQNAENSVGVRVIGFIFLAVHLCVGLTVLGIHFTNFQ